jgi:recombination protein RecA
MAKAVKEVETVEEKVSKAKRRELLMKKMEKNFGEGIVVGLNTQPEFHESISTGSIGLDKALGIGGLPRGRVVEI